MMTLVENDDVDLVQADESMSNSVEDNLSSCNEDMIFIENFHPIFHVEIVDILFAAKHCNVVGRVMVDIRRLLFR